jgi:hypothetical protein
VDLGIAGCRVQTVKSRTAREWLDRLKAQKGHSYLVDFKFEGMQSRSQRIEDITKPDSPVRIGQPVTCIDQALKRVDPARNKDLIATKAGLPAGDRGACQEPKPIATANRDSGALFPNPLSLPMNVFASAVSFGLSYVECRTTSAHRPNVDGTWSAFGGNTRCARRNTRRGVPL